MHFLSLRTAVLLSLASCLLSAIHATPIILENGRVSCYVPDSTAYFPGPALPQSEPGLPEPLADAALDDAGDTEGTFVIVSYYEGRHEVEFKGGVGQTCKIIEPSNPLEDQEIAL